MKDALIAEIEAIYRDHNYDAQHVKLEKYSEAQLGVHLKKLKAGAYEWMRGKAASPKSPPPPLYKGGDDDGVKDHRPEACATDQV